MSDRWDTPWGSTCVVSLVIKERVNTLEIARGSKAPGFQHFAPSGARVNIRVGRVDNITRVTIITKTRPPPYCKVWNSKESCQSEKKRVKRTLEVGRSGYLMP